MVQKAAQEANEWFMAQTVEEEWSQAEMVNHPLVLRKWDPPEHDWVMCNVGMEFSKSKGLVGGVGAKEREGSGFLSQQKSLLQH